MEKSKNLNQLYFIRLSDNKKSFVHLQNPYKPASDYILKEGVKGACLWEKENAENFIKESGANNLETVKASELLNN